MEQLKIYRRRMIPDECILLKDDVILEQTDDIIVTKWNTLKPRRDFHHGYRSEEHTSELQSQR